MGDVLMVLPAGDAEAIRLVRIPDDIESHEAFRHVTGIIASVEEDMLDFAFDIRQFDGILVVVGLVQKVHVRRVRIH